MKPLTFPQLFVMLNCCLILYTIMNTLGKDILSLPDGRALTFLEFSLFRSAYVTVTAFAMVRYKKISLTDVPRSTLGVLVFRCVTGLVTFIICAVPLSMIPLAVYQAVLSTTPFWIGVVSLLWLKISVKWYQWVAMIVSYSGIIVISCATPRADHSTDATQVTMRSLIAGILFTAAAAVGTALVAVSSKKLKACHYLLI